MSEKRYPQVLRAVSETPWAILPGTLAAILDMLTIRASGQQLSAEEIQARIGDGPAHRQQQTSGAVAVLPLYGVIAPKVNAMTDISGGTSVEMFASDFHSLMRDPNIKAVVIDIDSPGGQTSLITELAATIRQARGTKPIVAVANPTAASAAYWIGSQADELVATPSGHVGSIGVFGAHEDISAMNEGLGIKTTLVSAGKYKTEGTPLAPLTDDARAHWQSLVDSAYDMFVGDVAKGRGVSAEQVRNGFGEGRMVAAADAVKEGMIDRVATLEQTIGRMMNPNGRSRVSGSSASVFIDGDTKGAAPDPGQMENFAGPIRPHQTATSNGAWDNGGNKARLRNDGGEAYFKTAFAWQDDQADPDLKGSYKFIHHEVNADGDVGPANLTACSQGIGVLNGGRTGTTIPDSDRQGVWEHLAKHLSDAGREPPPLAETDLDLQAAASGLSFADEADELLRSLEAVVNRTETLRVLTGPKREQLTTLVERAEAVLAQHDPSKVINEDVAYDLEVAIRRF
jgi:signal peptide peptidase SppA